MVLIFDTYLGDTNVEQGGLKEIKEEGILVSRLGHGRRVLCESFDVLGSGHVEFEIQSEEGKKWKGVNY